MPSSRQLGGGGKLQPFEVGDHVQLAAGGPKMAVTAVHDGRDAVDGVCLVTCMWFTQQLGPEGAFTWKDAVTETFPAACLQRFADDYEVQ